MLKVNWKLNGNTLDSTPTGPDGTLNGTANWVSGHLNTDTALKFDGTTNYIDAGTSLSFTGQFTILMWAKLGTILTRSKSLITKGESVLDKDMNYGLALSPSNKLAFMTGDGINYKTFETTNPAITNANWHHVAAVYTSTTDMKIYIDGVQQIGTLAGSATTLTSNTKRILIGASSTTQELFDGTLQEIKIYDNALTQAEVIADMNSITTCPQLVCSITI